MELLPTDLFASVYDPTRWPVALRDRVVNVSVPRPRLPGAHRHYPKLLPFMNLAFESFDLSKITTWSCRRAIPAPRTCSRGAKRCTLLPHADAPRREGHLPRPASSASARPWRPACCLAGCAATTWPGRAGRTCSWRTPASTSRRASASTTGATRSSPASALLRWSVTYTVRAEDDYPRARPRGPYKEGRPGGWRLRRSAGR